MASIVSRTASSGDAVARVTPPTDKAETSNASGSPSMPSSSALAIGTDPEYTTWLSAQLVGRTRSPGS